MILYVSNNVWRDFRLLVPAFETEAGEIFNGKFTVKNDFLIWHFILPLGLPTLTLENLKSLHTLFDEYLMLHYLMLHGI